jgi:hypothetical protein
MKIQIWELRLYYNFCDFICNKYTNIIEFCIPDLGYSFNYYEDDVNIIKTNPDRYKNVNIITKIVRPFKIKEYEMSIEENMMYQRLITKID